MDDFEKQIPASACRKKKIACSTNEIEKKILHYRKEEKKMLQCYFIIQRALENSHSSLGPSSFVSTMDRNHSYRIG